MRTGRPTDIHTDMQASRHACRRCTLGSRYGLNVRSAIQCLLFCTAFFMKRQHASAPSSSVPEPRDGPRGKATFLRCSFPQRNKHYSIHKESRYIVVQGRKANCGKCKQPIEFLRRQRAPVPNNADGTYTRKWTEQPVFRHKYGPGMALCGWGLFHISCVPDSFWDDMESSDTESESESSGR